MFFWETILKLCEDRKPNKYENGTMKYVLENLFLKQSESKITHPLA